MLIYCSNVTTQDHVVHPVRLDWPQVNGDDWPYYIQHVAREVRAYEQEFIRIPHGDIIGRLPLLVNLSGPRDKPFSPDDLSAILEWGMDCINDNWAERIKNYGYFNYCRLLQFNGHQDMTWLGVHSVQFMTSCLDTDPEALPLAPYAQHE